MNKTEIKVPELSLITLIGISGSGKSTFAKKHFKKTEVVSSDECRGIVSDDENNQAATNDAFELLHYIVGKRLKNGLLTVVDATNIQTESRKCLLQLAKQYHCLPVAIVLNVPEKECVVRNEKREDRNFGKHVMRQQRSQLKHSLNRLKKEGFRYVYVMDSVEEIESITGIVRDKLYNDKKDIQGPFDIIGDVHGCYDELVDLLEKLGYSIQTNDPEHKYGMHVFHPDGRTAVFVGDLIDRGPKSPEALKLVISMVDTGSAICVPGNHDMKLHKYLDGKNVQLKHGLEQTVEQLKGVSKEFLDEVKTFLYGLVSHYVFDGGRLVVAHAGVKEEMQGRGSGAVRSFCLYGETTGETDEFGLPVRHNWAADYRGKAMVVYGHTPVYEPQWLNNTMDIDTGCVYGGRLTALRYPERELISVEAREQYAVPSRPFHNLSGLSSQQEHDDLLDLQDVLGKQIINTRLRNNVTVKEENAIAALEVMSRFAVNPKWLIYLPPTMSPTETSDLPEYLEHPVEAFRYFRSQGVSKVICEKKHMGSRAVIVVGRDEEVIKKRFGIINDGSGKCFTRTGRNFFNDKELEKAFLDRLINALTVSGFWETMDTDWVCLDAELMPWSAKAQALIRGQYAAVGVASEVGLHHTLEILNASRSIEGVDLLLEKYTEKAETVDKYRKAYRNYCWDVKGIDDFRLAPFHILATEGAVHTDKDHEWHINIISGICAADPGFLEATPIKTVSLEKDEEVENAINWWEKLTSDGGEGMVVKPLNFISTGKKGLIQPAIKCRGREYLRIIYGPEYTLHENLSRLKSRSLSRKRSLALREFALGVEALERFVKKEPLRKVHECVFGVLALESEPVDPRL